VFRSSPDISIDKRVFKDVFMLAFRSNGDFINHGRRVFVEVSYRQGYSSGQLITFEVDMFLHTLSVKIQERLAFLASGIDDRGVMPYVCMHTNETAMLLSRESLVASNSDPFPDEAIATEHTWEVDSNLGTVDCNGLFTTRQALEGNPVPALGSRKFSKVGVYTWALQLKNVKDTWIGVIKGKSARLKHMSPKVFGSGEQAHCSVLALSASGDFVNNLNMCRVLRRQDAGSYFCSGQVAEVAASVSDQWLKVRVDGSLVCVVSGVDMLGFQPYVVTVLGNCCL
jgi:hypothetical protein